MDETELALLSEIGATVGEAELDLRTRGMQTLLVSGIECFLCCAIGGGT